MKFIRPFRGARRGDAFPTEFKVGEDCPPELLVAATALGVVAEQEVATPVPDGKKPEGKAAEAPANRTEKVASKIKTAD